MNLHIQHGWVRSSEDHGRGRIFHLMLLALFTLTSVMNANFLAQTISDVNRSTEISGWALRPYTIYRVTLYRRNLAFMIPNMSFLARLVLDNSRSLEKFELAYCPQPHRKEKFLHGV